MLTSPPPSPSSATSPASPRKTASKHVTISVSDEEYILLRNVAAEMGLHQSQFTRSLLEGALTLLKHVRGGESA